MAVMPRVRPRVPIEDLVDRTAHPPRRQIATVPEVETPPLHWTSKAALVLMAVFIVSTALAGFLGPILGLWAGLGFGGLALSSLIVAYLLGAE